PGLPRGPSARSARDLGLPGEQARLLAYRAELGDFFEQAVAADGSDARMVANWVANELVARIGDTEPQETKLEAASLARLVAMVGAGEVSGNAAKEVLGVLVEEGGDPAAGVTARGLGPAGGDRLEQSVEGARA